MFFKEKNIDISSETYRRLFYGWKWFEKAYGVGKSDLLERYKYRNEYTEELEKNGIRSNR